MNAESQFSSANNRGIESSVHRKRFYPNILRSHDRICTSLTGLSLAALSRVLSGQRPAGGLPGYLAGARAWRWCPVVQGGRQGERAQ